MSTRSQQRAKKSWARSVSRSARHRGQAIAGRPAFGTRLSDQPAKLPFDAPERWHEPQGRRAPRMIVQSPGAGFIHPVSPQEVLDRLKALPERIQGQIDVVQFSRMTRKRQLFPCYGLQWGTAIYLYPIEDTLVETYVRNPSPQQEIEARIFGGRWTEEHGLWRLHWTLETLRDFYLNNILIHEYGHAVDHRNRCPRDRERFANWFAIEYGYRRSRRPPRRSAEAS